jgi:hypothetical protein
VANVARKTNQSAGYRRRADFGHNRTVEDPRAVGENNMVALKWWLRIVGVFYVLMGGGLTAQALLDRTGFAATWASTEASALDELAIRGAQIAGLPGVMTWALLGVLMLLFSRTPEKARVLVIVVALWELFVWIPSDIVGSFYGFTIPRTASLIAVHIVIGLSGLLLLRRAKA